MLASLSSSQLWLLLLLPSLLPTLAVASLGDRIYGGGKTGPTTAFAPIHRHLAGLLGPSVFETMPELANALFDAGGSAVALGRRQLKSTRRTIERPRKRPIGQPDAAPPTEAPSQVVLGASFLTSGAPQLDRVESAREAAAAAGGGWEEVEVNAPDLDDMPTVVELVRCLLPIERMLRV